METDDKEGSFATSEEEGQNSARYQSVKPPLVELLTKGLSNSNAHPSSTLSYGRREVQVTLWV